MEKRRYLVIAVYGDDFSNRYACEVEAESGEEAERMTQIECARENGYDLNEEPLIIAGVCVGRTDEETAAIEVIA